MTIDSRDRIKRQLAWVAGQIPLRMIEWLGRFPHHSVPHRIAKLGVCNRDVTIRQGVATGLKFNPAGSNPAYALGTNEPSVQQAFANYLKPGDTFYDIGANVGFFTVIGATLVGDAGKVYAFEPVSENAALVRRNAELNRFHNVTVFEQAVSSRSGKAELLLAHYSGGSTLSIVDTPPDLKGKVTVDVVSIDDLITQQNLLPPNMIKIDVEGAELNVLQGMTQTIKAYRPVILYEIDDGNRDAFERKQAELQKFIQSLGYTTSVLESAYPGLGWHVGHVVATSL
jgi:FkbM family methyltransferase